MLWHRFQESYAAFPVPAAPLCFPLRVPNFSKGLLSVTSSFIQVCIPQPTKEGIQDVKPVIETSLIDTSKGGRRSCRWSGVQGGKTIEAVIAVGFGQQDARHVATELHTTACWITLCRPFQVQVLCRCYEGFIYISGCSRHE